MADEFPDDAVLSDVDNDEDPSNAAAPSNDSAADKRLRKLLAELEQERRARKAAEDSRVELQTSVNRLKAFAQDVIKKRDDAKDEYARSAERANAELSEALRQKDEALRQQEDAFKQKEEALRQKEEAYRLKDSSRAEIETAAQMLVTGIEKISSKVSGFKNFSVAVLPRSQKYTGLPAVAYGVIKRANEIAEELTAQIEAAVKSRDEAREQIEQRNYEIAIEISQLEATISGLREEATKKGNEIELLGKMVGERDSRISEMEREIAELKQFGDDFSTKFRNLETKVDAQRPVIIDHLKHISKAYEQINKIVGIADENSLDQSDSSDSSFVWKEMDMDENLRTSLEGTVSICELASVAFEKVKSRIESRNRDVKDLEEKVAALFGEKQHIGTLLRSALYSRTNKVLQVAEEGLREAGIDLKLNGHDKDGANDEAEDEVYTLAGALENTVKTSQIEIVELSHLVEALRAESSLLKAHLDAQAKEISQQMLQIKELKEKEHMANENVEGLMTDIAAAEEEIARWKLAAEQEAAAGKEVEQEFLAQLSSLRQELEEAKHAMMELEKKLKFKEETAAAAIAARDAAETSLRLADVRTGRLRERVEELTRQLEQFDKNDSTTNRNSHRYVCWPWQWLGLDSVRYQTVEQQNSNEMELSEPLV
ncbi:plectin [Phalaenopsis equestris]|uniref:plectin n=1 Tax=Phalaenopsis equestris TaxID=78828 RepID=UPI0009E2C6FF|nr:plectin [Phalaenopsis equestris]